MSTLSQSRLYVVTATDTGSERLVRAENKARAVRLAAAARIATQSDLERLLAQGVKPEDLRPRSGAVCTGPIARAGHE